MSLDQVLYDLYYNIEQPSAYSGINALYKAANHVLPTITINDVKQWLSKQDTYTLHRQARRHFKHRRVYVPSIDNQFQIDLCDMRAIKSHNDGFAYILTCIDVFSKYAWCVPVKTKRPTDTAAAFESILSSGRKPKYVQSDEGTEFLGRPFQLMLADNDIKFFTSRNPDIKCSVVERFNRTLKSKMWRVFTKTRSRRWVDVLPRLVTAYNNTHHRSINMKPVDVNADNEQTVWNSLYGSNRSRNESRFKFNIGDQVRVPVKLHPFRKGYEPQWTEEIFKISRRLDRRTPMYYIKDSSNTEIKASYYEQELQKVVKDASGPYWVEEVLKSRRNRQGELEYFVKWSGYPASFNQWIPSSQFT